uniref:beta-ketoacyl-[acyl-carrier-protein] synthase I n=1 Tax=Musa acuminata subsp. malaccensis TaxID=214687 RepID=A0A804I091_MUSAM
MEALRRITRRPIRRRFLSSQAFDPPPAAPRRRVVVTGLGMVTPLGCGVGETWRRLVDERCGVRALTPADLRMDGFDEATVMHTYDQLTAKVAAIVPCGKGEGKFDEEQWLQSKDHRSTSRFIAYALCSTEEALRDANWLPTEPEKKERTGVSIGGGIGSISDILDAAQLICDKGPNHAAVTACATGAHSIGDATRMIQFGDADVMVAGGTESSIDALSIAGFCRSRALATKYNLLPQVSSRPFDCDRDGFVIGEGSGVMVLEELNHAKERGAKIYAEVRGYGMSGDAYHITQPHIDGKGAILAMTRALEQVLLHLVRGKVIAPNDEIESPVNPVSAEHISSKTSLVSPSFWKASR